MAEEGSVIHLPHLEDYPVHISLFKDVTNAEFLRQQLIEGNSVFEYAFLDATAILSTKHILAAVFRAINDLIHNRLRSKNVHSEIVFSLSPNNNIAESFRRFGVLPATSTLLAIKIPTAPSASPPPDPSTHLASVVQGTRIAFTDENLRKTADVARIAKIYRVDLMGGDGGKGGKKGGGGEVAVNGVNSEVEERQRRELESVILGIMALKGS